MIFFQMEKEDMDKAKKKPEERLPVEDKIKATFAGFKQPNKNKKKVK